jgi:hypothetical protein
MNSKSVLNKILTLLSLDETAVNFTDAKDAKGNILQSPTFDLGESVEVVDADGKKTPAPDGEHEIELTDSEGKKVVIRITTKDGKIESRENVEEANPADLAKPNEEVVDKSVEKKKEDDVKMADATKEEAHPLPNTTDEDPRNMITDDSEETEKDPLIALSYRISEMEKAMDMMKTKLGMNPPSEEGTDEAVAPSANLPEDGVAMSAEDDDEEDLPKLDGAPIESAGFKFSSDTIHKTNNSGKVPNSQNNFLSKLYS